MPTPRTSAPAPIPITLADLLPPGMWAFLPLCLLALVGVAECEEEPPTPTPEPISTPIPGGRVHGQAMVAGAAEDEPPVFIPDLTVRLVEEGGVEVDRAETDAFGRYRLAHQPPGSYELCWQGDGWISGCQADAVVVDSGAAYPPIIEAEPAGLLAARAKSLTTTLLTGKVELMGGESCWVDAPFFSFQQNAEVSLINLLSGLPLIPSVRTNADGSFVMPSVPVVSGVLMALQARCGGGLGEVILDLGDILPFKSTGALAPLSLTVEDHAPQVRALYALQAGGVVTTVRPGAVVDVVAETSDADGDPLSFTWRPDSGSGSAVATGAGAARWTLPGRPGLHTLHVLVDDGQGGVVAGQLDVAVTLSSQLSLSGAVLGDGGAALPGLRVRVGGEDAEVDAAGAFTAEAEEGEPFALTASAPGHAPWSEILEGKVAELRWRLPAAQVFDADPAADIDLRVDGQGGAGLELHIPGGALVDGAGSPPAGDVRLSVAPLDPTRQPLPGGSLGERLGGGQARIRGLAGASVEVTDPSGQIAYNLAPGASATLRFLAPSALVAAGLAPASAPVWLLDEASGRWEEEGAASFDGAAWVYAAPHFSVRSVGAAEGETACARLRMDGSIRLPVQVEIEIPTSASTSEIHRVTLTQELSAIHDLPPDRVVTVVPLDRQGAPMEIARMTVNTGDALDGDAGWRPGSPYTACGSEATLSAIPEPSGFSNGWMWLTAEGRPDRGEEAAQTQAYYDRIDPAGARATLGGWWAANGFDPQTGDGGTRATFYNAGELAYWRDMHCRQDPATDDVACWVSKYHDGGAAITGDTSFTGETVAMEYRSLEAGRPRTVTFAAYAGGEADAPRVTSADFDGMGNRYLPWVCANCHGGTYEPADKANPTLAEVETGANFLMFDLDSFDYSERLPRAAQEDAFYDLNQLVKATQPPQAVRELIDGWYDGGASRIYDGSWRPPSWEGFPQSGLYEDFVRSSCRSCHVSQDNLEWNVYQDGDDATTSDVARPAMRRFIRLLVCGTNHMPHARPTYTRFWTSEGPHQPTYLAQYQDLSVGWTPFGECD